MSNSTNRNKEMFLNQIREIYEEDLLRKADLVLTVKQEEAFGTFLWMNNKPTLEKTLKELRLPDLLINTKSDVIKACEYIESSELGYSYDTVVSMKQQYEVEKDNYAKIVYLINYYEKEVHKAQTLIKNTQLQNEWLKKENLDGNLKRSSTGRELEDIDDKMNEIKHQIKMNHQTEMKIRSSLIPVQAAYDTHHVTLLQIQSKYNELQQSMKLSDTFLHPMKTLDGKKELKALAVQAQKESNEVSRNQQMKDDLHAQLNQIIEEIKEAEEEIKRLQEMSQKHQEEISNRSNLLFSGEQMILKGEKRLKEFEEKKNTAQFKLEETVKEKEIQRRKLIDQADQLLHTWIGYDETFHNKLNELKQKCKEKNEITKEDISFLFLSPYLFTMSGSTALQYMKQAIIGNTLITNMDIERQLFKKKIKK